MSANREIPERLQEKVNAMPECSYGVARIHVTLDDGSQYRDVYVAWGSEIVRVGVDEHIPFDPSRIVSVDRG